jgi:hypothetical protein
MFYSVKGRYIPQRLSEFFKKLTDGSIADQEPDGKEIVAAMKRAVVTQPGIVQWTEMCFCAIPLDHERQTVYDHFFTEMEIHEVKSYSSFDGKPFMELMTESV